MSGATYRTHNSISTPMAFNAAFRVYDNLQVGVSFYTPYGSSINWTRDWPGSVLSQKVNLMKKELQYTLTADGETVGSPLMTILSNDLQYFKEKMAPGRSSEAVLVFETDKKQTLQNMSIQVTNGKMTGEITIH